MDHNFVTVLYFVKYGTRGRFYPGSLKIFSLRKNYSRGFLAVQSLFLHNSLREKWQNCVIFMINQPQGNSLGKRQNFQSAISKAFYEKNDRGGNTR